MSVIESKDQNDRTLLYRRVFNTPDGKAVLQDMLLELKVFSSINPDAQEIALRNYGLSLMYNLGILVDTNLELMVDKLMSMDYKSIEL